MSEPFVPSFHSVMVPLHFWFRSELGLACPEAYRPRVQLGYYATIMFILKVSSIEEIKQLAKQHCMNFTEFCISVYDSQFPITVVFNREID